MGWLAGYAYRRKFSTQYANIDGALTNFPLLVALDSYSPLQYALATGYDLRVTQSDGQTLQDYDRITWSGGDGSAASFRLRTLCPSLSAVAATDQYLYWGKAGASDGADSANAYDAYTRQVLHLEEGDSTAADYYKDATGSNHATLVDTDGDSAQGTGKVGYGMDLDGDADYLMSNDLITALADDEKGTVEAWCNLDLDPSAAYTIFSLGDDNSNLLYLRYRGYTEDCIEAGFTDWRLYSPVNSTDSLWGSLAYICVAHNGAEATIYIDGVAQAKTWQTSRDKTAWFKDRIDAGADKAWWGAMPYTGGSPVSFFDGVLDECTVSGGTAAAACRSADWIKFQYHNTSEADNELTWGDLEFNPAFAAAAALPRHPVQIHRPLPAAIPY